MLIIEVLDETAPRPMGAGWLLMQNGCNNNLARSLMQDICISGDDAAMDSVVDRVCAARKTAGRIIARRVKTFCETGAYGREACRKASVADPACSVSIDPVASASERQDGI